MSSAVSQSPATGWLVENGPKELELLFRAIVYHPSAPILVADDDGNTREASVGAGKLLGLPREKIIGRPVGDFAPPASKAEISRLWKALQERGEQEGTLRLVGSDARPREVEYTGKGNVLPVRHILVLHDKTAPGTERASADRIPAWVQDYALFLLDIEGHDCRLVCRSGAYLRLSADEAIDQHVSFLYPGEENAYGRAAGRTPAAPQPKAMLEPKAGSPKKDGSRFWANAITMALKDENGELQGFARVVRDFSDRHERDEKLRRSRARISARPRGIDHRRRRFRRVRPYSRSERRVSRTGRIQPRGSAGRPAALARSHSAGIRRAG